VDPETGQTGWNRGKNLVPDADEAVSFFMANKPLVVGCFFGPNERMKDGDDQALMEELKTLIRRDWPYFFGVAVFFLVMVVLGYFLPICAPQMTRMFQNSFFERLRQLAALIRNQSFLVQIGVIWLNNLTASTVAILFGILLGAVPLFSLIGNGLAIGMAQRLLEQRGLGGVRFYLGLLPHGVFELSAFFIAVGLGIRLGMIPFRLIWQHHMTQRRRPLFRIFYHEARRYWALIAILLLVAATIEITVSPLLLK
jgi:stage II sporulation protein M